MIRTLFYALCILVYLPVHAQTLQNESKIKDYLGQERFDEIQNSNPNYLKFLDVRCSQGFKVIDYVDEKMSAMTVVQTITFKNGCELEKDGSCKENDAKYGTITAADFLAKVEDGSINILKYNLSYDRSKITYFVLGNTGKVLMLFPVEYINKITNS